MAAPLESAAGLLYINTCIIITASMYFARDICNVTIWTNLNKISLINSTVNVKHKIKFITHGV